ncbi:MAG: PAS domain-containing sensor histidine kinase [Ignavibacteria bacterium]|nr:PAS domain-containing sensor histidine kinase [Ignavibacteria bacterium]
MEIQQKIKTAYFNNYLNNVEEGIAFITKDLKVTYLNEKFKSIIPLDESSKKISFDSILKSFNPENQTLIQSKINLIINNQIKIPEQLKIVEKVESENIFKLNLIPVIENELVEGLFFSIRKIASELIVYPGSSKFEGFLDLISSASGDIIYQLDYTTGKYNYLSPGMEDLTGYSFEEMNKIGFQKLIKKVERFAMRDNTDKELSQKITEQKSLWVHNEYLILTKENEKKWVDDRGKKIKNSDGKIIGIFGVLRDITERKKMVSALFETEKNYKAVLDYSPFGVAVIQNFKVVYANKEILKLLKIKKLDHLIGKSVIRFIPKERVKIVEEIFQKTFVEQVPLIHSEESILDRNRKRVEVRSSSIPIHYNGKPSLLLVMEDISTQKKAESIKVVLNEILHLANSNTDIAEFYKFIHHSVKKLMKADNLFIALYDAKSDMISFPYFVDEYDDDVVPIKSGKSLTDYVIKTKSSQLIDIERDYELRQSNEVDLIGSPAQIWLGVPLVIRDEIIGVIVLQDYHNKEAYTRNEQEILETISYTLAKVIENKLIEEEKKNLIAELKATNFSKDKFFSIISHDLRGPFNAILGYTSILKNEYKSLSQDEIIQFIDSLHQATFNVYKLLNDLLEYSRFQLGRIEYNPTKQNLNLLVVSNIQTLQGNFDSKQIKTKVDIDDNLEIYVDEQMMNSIVQNLLTNAVKFSFLDGTVNITAVQKPDEKMVEVEIQDEGVGMSAEEISRLFRLDSVYTKVGTAQEIGTGFGLILIKEFIEKHGGKISVKSQLKIGSTFGFTIPIAL